MSVVAFAWFGLERLSCTGISCLMRVAIGLIYGDMMIKLEGL